MVIKSLKLKNILNLPNRDFTFNNGINIIYGDNGTGKTNLINAVIFCLFGSSFISYKMMIKHGSGRASIELDSDIGLIKRDIAENSMDIYFNGDMVKENILQSTIGIDHKMFISNSYFNMDMINNTIFKMGTSTINELCRIFKIPSVDKLLPKVRKKINDIKSKNDYIKNNTIYGLTQKNKEYTDIINKDMDIDSIKSAKQDYVDVKTKSNSHINDIINSKNQLIRYKQILTNLKDNTLDITKYDINKLQENYRNINNELNKLYKNDLSVLNNLNCPSCNTPLDILAKNNKHDIGKLEQRIKKGNKYIKQHNEKTQLLRDKIKIDKGQNIENIDGKVKEYDKRISTIENSKNEEAKIKQRINNICNEYRISIEDIDTIETYKEILSKNIKNIDDTIKYHTEEIEKYNSDINDYTLYGIVKKDASLVQIKHNMSKYVKYINEIMKDVFIDNIELNYRECSKKGMVFYFSKNNVDDISFNMLSKNEKKFVTYCNMITNYAILNHDSVIFLDEIDDSADLKHKKMMYKSIEGKSNQVVIVTHDYETITNTISDYTTIGVSDE